MARWRLTAAHYLNSPGVEWEYKETDQSTGRQNRLVLPVPLLLDPRDPNCCNRDGDCIACHGPAGRGEFEFLGDPTPDMEPLDAEAKALSASLAHKWKHPIESLPSDFSASLISSFEKQMAEVLSSGKGSVAPVSANAVSAEDFVKLQTQVAELMAQNAELQAKSEPKASRRL